VSAPPPRLLASRAPRRRPPSTYVLSWEDARGEGGSDDGIVFVVERSTSSSFATIRDAQTLRGQSASFLATDIGTTYHRLRVVPACDGTLSSAPSNVLATNVTSGAANVVFTSAPQGVALRAGQPASGAGTTFKLENIGDTAAEVTLVADSRGESFFEIRDAGGAIATDVTLQPRTPQTFGVRFTGPSGQSAWDGSVSVVARAGRPRLPVTPGATVSLVTGSATGDAAARFSINGIATEALAFPGLSGDDAQRPPLEVIVENPGTQPVSFAYEIGPELWLEAEAGWNATPVPPGGRRTVRLFTRRSRAPEGASFPRETFLTLRTPGGATSRLLVLDNDAPAVQALRSPLPTSAISYIVPSVVNATSALGNTFVSTVQLTNAGSEALATELVFTPAGREAAGTRPSWRVKLDVPAHGSVRLRDPLGSLSLPRRPGLRSSSERVPLGTRR
jgi:hypothetical protein